MAKITAIANQKGGVGKTTTSVNLAASLANQGQKVLLIDLDPQGNATMGSGVEKNQVTLAVQDVLMDQASTQEVMQYCEKAGYHLLPANNDLVAAEVSLIDANNKSARLSQALKHQQDKFDHILIDCPPSLNMLTVNGLACADGVLIPVQCEYYALEGITALLQTIKKIKQTVNPALIITGILRTMYDPRNSLTMDVSQQLIKHFDKMVFTTLIPRNVRLAEAPSYGMPVLLYDKYSKGATAYEALAKEFIQKQGTNHG